MRQILGKWVREHRAEVELRWLEVCSQTRAYATFPPRDRLRCWDPLIEALAAGDNSSRSEMVREWVDREVRERGAKMTELLAVAEGLSQAVGDLTPARAEQGQVWRAAYGLITALAGHFAGEAERLAAQEARAENEFITSVSHELRTPMTAIKGYTDLITAGAVGPTNVQQHVFLESIQRNSDRLAATIDDLLDMSQVGSGRVRFERRLVQIGGIIGAIVSELRPQAEEKHQRLTHEVAHNLPDVSGEPDRLSRVLRKLVVNAIHYTPKGGEIEVTARGGHDVVQVAVRDTGIGIALADIPHLFERFYRADHPVVQETQGAGLGLSIVKMYIEMHDGQVWVESEPDEGSTFAFELPIPRGIDKA